MRRPRLAAAALVAALAGALTSAPGASAANGQAQKIQPIRPPIILPPTLAPPEPPIATRIALSAASTIPSTSPVTLTAYVFDWKGNLQQGKNVSFSVLDGPDAGAALKPSSNPDGSVSTPLSRTRPGIDVIQATYSDGLEIHRSNRVFVEWRTGPPAAAVRSPAVLQVSPNCFQPASAEARASDTLKTFTPRAKKATATQLAPETGTITVAGTDFNPFSAVLITFDAGPGGRPQNFTAQTDAFGVFSRDIQVTEPGEGVHLVRADDLRQREAQATYRLPCWQGTVALDPPIGPPGFVTFVVGRNFPPKSPITFLNWNKPYIASPLPNKSLLFTDAQGSFQFPILVLYHDGLGPRTLRAVVQDIVSNEGNALIAADAPFMVTLGRAQPDDLVIRR